MERWESTQCTLSENLDEETKAQLHAAFQDLKDAKASGDQDQIDAAKQALRSLFESIKAQNE